MQGHRTLTALVAALLLAGCGDSTPPPTAAAYVSAHAKAANAVVVSVQEIRAGVGILKASPDMATEASFQQLLTSAKSQLDSAKSEFAMASAPTGMDQANLDMFGAVDELETAIDSAHAFVDSQKPSDLADFDTHWQQGMGDWNSAVHKIWTAAKVKPPTV